MSALSPSKSTTGSGHSVLYKNVPASPNKTYMACIQLASDLGVVSNSHQTGLAVRNNSNGKVVVFTASSNSQLTFTVVEWTTTTSFNSVLYTTTGSPPAVFSNYIVLAINFDGTNLSFRYSPYYNGSESNFIEIYTTTVAAFLGSFDSWGLTIFKNAGTLNTLYCDWLRVV